MYSFLSEYFSSVVFVLHAIRCRVAQAGSQGPTEYSVLVPTEVVGPGRSIRQHVKQGSMDMTQSKGIKWKDQ
jgi:hypothetical protein